MQNLLRQLEREYRSGQQLHPSHLRDVRKEALQDCIEELEVVQANTGIDLTPAIRILYQLKAES